MVAEKFLQELKKEVPPLMLLTGDEYYYLHKVVKAVKSSWFSGMEENTASLQNEVSPEHLASLVYANSFFSEKSLLIIEQSFLFAGVSKLSAKEEEAYLKIYQNIPEHCRVILKCEKPDKRTKRYKVLSKLAFSVECEKVKNYQLKNYLEALARERGCKFEVPALNLVTEYLAALEHVSLYFLEQEVEKLYLYTLPRNSWSKEDVENIFSKMPGVSGFALTRAMLEQNTAKALELLREQIAEGEQVLSIAGRIAWQVRNLWLTKCVLKEGGTAKDVQAQTELAPFLVSQFSQESKKFSEKQLETALLELSKINREARLGGRGAAHLEEVIINFCRKAG